ncbi:hypothetical protein L2E82_02810 [Cichorium intybus]|uniref:Uncharacterized protein n=1 Tax=Cichorium intybus TaxID=13427 RepID=A0ACB9H405_CICIN|nr:hypothetical protein L2E82_02810 [Cichorium intybus]
MGGYLNIPKPLTTSPPPLPSSPPPQRPNLPMLYYGLVVVATAAIVLAFYNLIIVRWCTIQYQRRLQHGNQHSRRRRNPTSTMSPQLSGGSSVVCLVSSFKYKKGEEGNKNQLDSDTECSVCLSVFEEGEELRKLPMCNHCFHAYCIDMWLYSHTDCPLCRAPVVEPPPPPG